MPRLSFVTQFPSPPPQAALLTLNNLLGGNLLPNIPPFNLDLSTVVHHVAHVFATAKHLVPTLPTTAAIATLLHELQASVLPAALAVSTMLTTLCGLLWGADGDGDGDGGADGGGHEGFVLELVMGVWTLFCGGLVVVAWVWVKEEGARVVWEAVKGWLGGGEQDGGGGAAAKVVEYERVGREEQEKDNAAGLPSSSSSSSSQPNSTTSAPSSTSSSPNAPLHLQLPPPTPHHHSGLLGESPAPQRHFEQRHFEHFRPDAFWKRSLKLEGRARMATLHEGAGAAYEGAAYEGKDKQRVVHEEDEDEEEEGYGLVV
ncbi:hypothetical protein BDV95DRAFT_600689 [Massariosphaeria phaeospora]|uniref:Uncharacterized protein n=1 Tax=Massariosphaeria phaeospora TaxID=100035 RepID=A0A7C8IF08_9PLEO|nr:hypothetical protein BDV95DRAFT_600689 [Massariosphaeria phaeospora]